MGEHVVKVAEKLNKLNWEGAVLHCPVLKILKCLSNSLLKGFVISLDLNTR